MKRARVGSREPVPANENWEGVSAGVRKAVEKESGVVLDDTSFRQIAAEIKAQGKTGNSVYVADEALHRLGFNPRVVEHYDAYRTLALRLRAALVSGSPRTESPHLTIVKAPSEQPAEGEDPQSSDDPGVLTDAEWKRIRKQIPLDRRIIDAETDKPNQGWRPDAEA